MPVEKHFHIIVPVWGESYTRVFSNIVLHMFIENSNLNAVPINALDRFIIVTRWEDSIVIKKSEAFKKLQLIMPVKFILIDGAVNFSNTYTAMSQCYEMAMYAKEVIPLKTYFIFLTPDCFWTSGTFKRIYELRESGYKMATAMAMRVNAETATIPLLDFINSTDRSNLSVEFFIELIINNLHPMTSSMDLLSTKNDFFNGWPSNLYWINKNDQQIIAHCFHMHPLMVQSPLHNVAIPKNDTVDGNYLENLKYPKESIFVLQDNYFGIDLTDPKRTWNAPLGPAMINQIINFSVNHAQNCHFNFFKHRVTISTHDSIDPDLDFLIVNTVAKIADGRNFNIRSKKYIFKKKLFGILRKTKKILFLILKPLRQGIRIIKEGIR